MGLLAPLHTSSAGSYIGTSTAASTTPIGGIVMVRRTSDSANKNNQTLANDTQLLWSVAANETWFFEMYAIATAANATMDIQFHFTVPTSATMAWGSIGNGTQVTQGYMNLSTGTSPTAMLTESDNLLLGTFAGKSGHYASGIVAVSSTAGSVTLQWAQNLTDAGNLVLNTNSFIRALRLA